MSLINQMLQDLEKRRASGTERGALPNQVRVLPRAQRFGTPWWLLGIGAAVAAIILLAWQLTHPLAPAQNATAEQAPIRPPAPAVTAPQPGVPASRPAFDPQTTPEDRTTPALPPSPEAKISTPHEPAPLKAPKVVDAAAKISRAAQTAANTQSRVNPPVATTAVIAAEAVAVPKSVPATPKVEPAKAAAAAEPAKPVPAAPEAGNAANVKPAVSGATAKVPAALANPQIDKRSQQLTSQQLAENEYRDAANFLSQGRLAEAQEGFRSALQHYPGHIGARQGLFGLLMEAKKSGEAEQVLQDGLKLNPNQPNFAILLANLQYERGDAAGAIETLQKTAPTAQGSPDYLARLAGLLQRQSRHQEAVDHYQAALRLAPGSGVWLMGLGISLQALNRNTESQEAFSRAKATNTLNPELQAFVDQRLKQLQ